MACRLMAPRHYCNQCWIINNEFLWQSAEGNFTGKLPLLQLTFVIQSQHFPQMRWFMWLKSVLGKDNNPFSYVVKPGLLSWDPLASASGSTVLTPCIFTATYTPETLMIWDRISCSDVIIQNGEFKKKLPLLWTTFSNRFLWIKTVVLWLKFHWNVFPLIQSTTRQHRVR